MHIGCSSESKQENIFFHVQGVLGWYGILVHDVFVLAGTVTSTKTSEIGETPNNELANFTSLFGVSTSFSAIYQRVSSKQRKRTMHISCSPVSKSEKYVLLCTKGQLISKCPFDVIVWTKIPTKKFPRFLP